MTRSPALPLHARQSERATLTAPLFGSSGAPGTMGAVGGAGVGSSGTPSVGGFLPMLRLFRNTSPVCERRR
jgi:hypothetical protein